MQKGSAFYFRSLSLREQEWKREIREPKKIYRLLYPSLFVTKEACFGLSILGLVSIWSLGFKMFQVYPWGLSFISV